MKKITFLAALSLVILTAASTQAQSTSSLQKEKNERHKEKKAIRKEEHKIREGEVGYQTQQQFARDFPGAKNMAFSRFQNVDEVRFMMNGTAEKAYYDNDSKLIGTVLPQKTSDLPKGALNHIQKDYKKFSIVRVIMFDDNESNESDMWLYGHQFEDRDNYFVEIADGAKKEVLQVNMEGDVSFFSEIK